MSAALSRYRLVSINWSGRRALTVVISTEYTDRYIQMYAGRKLVGVSAYPGHNRVIGQVEPSHCPPPITLLMVEAANRNHDYGAQLPRRPWNRFLFRWTAASFPADARWFGIFAATEAGGDVDYDTELARLKYLGDGGYSHELPTVNEYGTWKYAVVPYDDAAPSGNAGTPAELAIAANPYPPDIAIDDNDQRLTTSIAAGVLTVGFAYDWEEQPV